MRRTYSLIDKNIVPSNIEQKNSIAKRHSNARAKIDNILSISAQASNVDCTTLFNENITKIIEEERVFAASDASLLDREMAVFCV